MVITRIIGGLGNQMFQYAAGFALAKRLKTELFLDVSEFKILENNPDATQRIYKLIEYNIHAKTLSNIELDHYKSLVIQPGKKKSLIDQALQMLHVKSQSFVMFQLPDDEACVYFPEVEKVRGNIYLKGFFQSEKYFEQYEAELRQHFTLRYPLPPDIIELKQEIFAKNAVSIHFRRSDYINHPIHSKNFGTPPLSYYHEAIEYFKKHLDDPYFYIFSDDLAWVKENFKTDVPHQFVSYIDFVEMHLMSCCKHHIIANSSFSWWGAWLNDSETKKVIAPSQWFKDISIPSEDIYKEDWIKI